MNGVYHTNYLLFLEVTCSVFKHKKEELNMHSLGKIKCIYLKCTCNPATLEADFWSNVVSVPVKDNSPLVGGGLCEHCVNTYNPAQGKESE